jgi:Ca-activated chloride channel family protein
MMASVVFLGLGMAGIALTLSQPRWGTSEQQVERRGVDLIFVLDTSLSMATRDIAPNRLWVAQTLIRQLVQDLPGNRLGLVQAEGDGVVMVPLTGDAAVIDLLLDAVQPGSLPTPGTRLSSALARALELFPEAGDKHRVMVLLSDGEDHGSGLERMANKLKEEGTVVHTIGVGTREGKPLELPEAETGAGLVYKTDQEGNVVVSRLMEESLETLSRKTGGLYLRAESAATDLGPLVRRIEAMEKKSYGTETVNTLEDRFQWPLALAILAILLHLAITPFKAATETRGTQP